MCLNLIPFNKDAGIYGKPNGFWNAFFVETPVSQIVGAEYMENGKVQCEHEGFRGGWFSEQEATSMHCILTEYIKTDEFKNHRYFAERQEQMETMLEFLPVCCGFKRD
ncbi:hypothetical protein [Photobacterium damselae]|uniref:hypothetical protein n=1 Tax=Photobacterium damselae TaxID=38293 RepID=UPI001F3F7E10|nr:hypothetical protein [Photobacterium damselae]UKA05028.1 hypothetical protein IHC89_22540 [Photobacterium damselae subsp. damselae]